MKKVKKMIKYYDINKLLTGPIISTTIVNPTARINQILPTIRIENNDPNNEDIKLNSYEKNQKIFIDELFDHLDNYPKEFLNNFFKCVNYGNNTINIGIPIKDINYNIIHRKLLSYDYILSSHNCVTRCLILHFNDFIGNKVNSSDKQSMGGNYAIFNNNKFANPLLIMYNNTNNHLYHYHRAENVGGGLFEYLNLNGNIYKYNPYTNNNPTYHTFWSPTGNIYENKFIENYKENISFYNIIVEAFFNKLGIEGNGFHLQCNDETMNYFFDKLENFIVDKELINLEKGLSIVKLPYFDNFQIEFKKLHSIS